MCNAFTRVNNKICSTFRGYMKSWVVVVFFKFIMRPFRFSASLWISCSISNLKLNLNFSISTLWGLISL